MSIVEVDNADKVSIGQLGNGALSHLDTLFFTLEPVENRVPLRLLSMPASLGITEVNYAATQEFMRQVVKAGPIAGATLFVSGDPAIQRFYEARKLGLAIEMLLSPTPGDADPRAWAVRVMGTKAARSVRERKSLVYAILSAHRQDLLKDSDRRLNLFSIASGWGRLPLDVIKNIDDCALGQIRGVLVDQDAKAIEASRQLAIERGLSSRVVTRVANAFALRHDEPASADLIESTGFTDYLEDRLVARLFGICRRLVSADGVVVITNITSDKEKEYLDIVWGEMHRRTPEQLAAFAQSVGFDPSKTTLILDSTDTMCTIVARP